MPLMYFVVVAVASLLGSALADEDCTYTAADGTFYDLSALKNHGSGYSFKYTAQNGEDYSMHVSICEPLALSPCLANTSFCQEWAGNGKKTLGRQPLQSWAQEEGMLVVTSSVGETSDSGTCQENEGCLYLRCDHDATVPSFSYRTVAINSGVCSYEFEVSTREACPASRGPSVVFVTANVVQGTLVVSAPVSGSILQDGYLFIETTPDVNLTLPEAYHEQCALSPVPTTAIVCKITVSSTYALPIGGSGSVSLRAFASNMDKTSSPVASVTLPSSGQSRIQIV